MQYPAEYLGALNVLIGNRCHRSAPARLAIARALRALRRRGFGRARVRRERDHMFYVNPGPWVR